jgi:hypothetical protein
MAQAASCHTCIYAYWDRGLWLRTLWSGFPAGPMCANHTDSPGRLKECPSGRVCRNYRPRPPTPKGENVKLIPLDGGFYAYVDAEDFEWLNQWRWHVCGSGYAGRHENGKLIFMHRAIMKPPKGMVVDHINGNRFDNTRANLRNVTPQENLHNTRKQAGTSSIYKGIYYQKNMGKWYAEAKYRGARSRAGPFEEEAEAGRAYDRMAVELFGERAWPNFPEEWPPERRARVYAAAKGKRKALLAKAARARARKVKAGKKKAPKAAGRQKPSGGRQRERKRRTRSSKPPRRG